MLVFSGTVGCIDSFIELKDLKSMDESLNLFIEEPIKYLSKV